MHQSIVRGFILTALIITFGGSLVMAETLYINGYYQSHTSSSITVLVNDYITNLTKRATYEYDASTSIGGCALAEVQKGTTINATYDTDAKLLQTVQFDQCTQRVDVYGAVTSNSGTSLTLRNKSIDSPFRVGEDVTITYTAETPITSCQGAVIDVSAFVPGTIVSTNGFRTGASSMQALAVYGQVNCPTEVSSLGTFVALSDTSVTLDLVVYGNVEFKFSGRGNVPAGVDTSAFPLFACWTEPVAWSSLTTSDTLLVRGHVYPDGIGGLYDIIPTRGCPPGISIAIGFNGYAVVSGTISAIADTAVQIQGVLGGAISLATRSSSSSEPSMYYSCGGTVIALSDFKVGDNVYAVFSSEDSKNSIRQLVLVSDCSEQQLSVRATITSVSDTEWTLLSGQGNELRISTNEKSTLYDCLGFTSTANDPRLVGYGVYANINVSASGDALLISATVDGTCNDVVSYSGKVTSISADSMTIENEEGTNTVIKPEQVYVYSIDGGYGSWEDIQVGEAVCATFSRGLFSTSAIYVFLGYTCDGRPTSEVVSTKGIVREVSPDHLEIESEGALIKFKVTPSTQVSGAYSHRTLSPGTRVDVSSMLTENLIEPTAMSVSVLRNGTTSVTFDEQRTTKTLLSPNPASDELRLTSDIPVLQIQIVSMDGALVASSLGSRTVSVSNVASGPYVALIKGIDGNTRTQLVHVLR